MLNFKIVVGIIAAVVGFIGYIPYFRDIFRNKTKPHIFSWFVWGLLTAIVFFAQIAKGAGAGAWVTGFAALSCFAVVILAIFKGEKKITISDSLALAGALLGLFLWIITDNPLSAVILITLTDALAFIPTIRKAYADPEGETLSAWISYSLKFAIGLAALESYNITTLLYPVALVLMNGSFALMLYMRR